MILTFSDQLERYIFEMHQFNVYSHSDVESGCKEVPNVVRWKPEFEGQEPPF